MLKLLNQFIDNLIQFCFTQDGLQRQFILLSLIEFFKEGNTVGSFES